MAMITIQLSLQLVDRDMDMAMTSFVNFLIWIVILIAIMWFPPIIGVVIVLL